MAGSLVKGPTTGQTSPGGHRGLRGKGGRRSTGKKGFMSTPAQAPQKGFGSKKG